MTERVKFVLDGTMRDPGLSDERLGEFLAQLPEVVETA